MARRLDDVDTAQRCVTERKKGREIKRRKKKLKARRAGSGPSELKTIVQ